MRILISNDDGYHSPGILALANALSAIAEVRVIAPERNRSGASNSLTLDRPLTLRQADHGFYVVNGTPTDCVHLALTGALDFVPDLVCSGINDGANLGDDTIYSGTVAAAMEGMQFGVPAIAFSMLNRQFKQLDLAAGIARQVVERLAVPLSQHQAAGLSSLINVNIPDVDLANVRGWQVTRLGKRHAAQAAIKQISPRGGALYWIGPAGASRDGEAGTDFHAVEAGYVSVTPLAIDLTAHAMRDTVSDWLAL